MEQRSAAKWTKDRSELVDLFLVFSSTRIRRSAIPILTARFLFLFLSFSLPPPLSLVLLQHDILGPVRGTLS